MLCNFSARARSPGRTGKPLRRHRAGLILIKLVHTAAWLSIESCMAYLLWTGLTRRSDRRATIAAGVVAGECVVFIANGFRCPLTDAAERFGAERGSVTDIYLPRWFAQNLPAIHLPLIALAGYLHARNLSRASRVVCSDCGEDIDMYDTEPVVGRGPIMHRATR